MSSLSVFDFIKNNRLNTQAKKLSQELNQAGIFSTVDLLKIKPKKTILIPQKNSFDQAMEGEIFRGEGEVLNFKSRPLFYRRSKSMLYFVQMQIAEKGIPENRLFLNWHNCYSNLMKKLKDLSSISFYGKVEYFRNSLCLNNPTIITDESQVLNSLIEYAPIGEVSGKRVKNLFNKIKAEHFELLKHHLDQVQLNSNHYTYAQIQKTIHGKTFTKNAEQNQIELKKTYESLAYLNLMEFELKSLAKRKNREKINCRKINFKPISFYLKILNKVFPYKLTDEQKLALTDVFNDFNRPYPMNRLLQGDVGSGKSSIAYASTLIMAIHGFQSAIMVPTETLALQQYAKLNDFILLFNKIFNKNIQVALLTGSTKSHLRKQILEGLKDNKIKILIGTHALFNEKNQFSYLELIIVDEQQKFGVNQRLKLSQKNKSAHYLSMTATPIPRTQQETLSKEIDISLIKNKPHASKINTRIITKDNFQKFLSFIQTRLELGEQIYVVTPKITAENENQQEAINLQKARKFFADNFSTFQQSTVHGQQTLDDKGYNFQQFLTGESQILISTTVIEVGVDNPNATVMIIFDANNFGLSTLHQLRGRVGRGHKNGFCFLLPRDLTDEKEILKKLQYLEESTDGFYLAQKDLELRGAGDLYGEKQSGNIFESYLNLKNSYPHLWENATKEAQKIIYDDSSFSQIANHYLESKYLQKSI